MKGLHTASGNDGTPGHWSFLSPRRTLGDLGGRGGCPGGSVGTSSGVAEMPMRAAAERGPIVMHHVCQLSEHVGPGGQCQGPAHPSRTWT